MYNLLYGLEAVYKGSHNLYREPEEEEKFFSVYTETDREEEEMFINVYVLKLVLISVQLISWLLIFILRKNISYRNSLFHGSLKNNLVFSFTKYVFCFEYFNIDIENNSVYLNTFITQEKETRKVCRYNRYSFYRRHTNYLKIFLYKDMV